MINRVLTFLFLFLLLCSYAGATDWSQDSDCIGVYTFEEASGNLLDKCVNTSNDGTISGGVVHQSTGVFGFGYDFPGSNDWVDFGDITDFDGITAFTVCAWILADTLTNNDYSVIRKDGTLTPLQINTQAGGKLRMPTWNGGLDLQEVSHSFGTETYKHYCARWSTTEDSGQVEMFINASSIGSSSTSQVQAITSSGNKVLRFGATESGGEDFDGKMDEVLFIKRFLTQSEITDIKTNGLIAAEAEVEEAERRIMVITMR